MRPLIAWLVLIAGRRRRTARHVSALGDQFRAPRRTAEEELTATLHQRTVRRSKMRLDPDPIVASMAVGAPDRRRSRRPPPI